MDDRAADASQADAQQALRAELRLSMVPGVGPRIRRALVERFGRADLVLAAAPSDLRAVEGVGPKLVQAIADAEATCDVDAELALCHEHGISILTDGDPRYPDLLRQIHDPPPVLFLRGEPLPCDAMSIAIVGSRHATRYGIEQAERLASSLARAGLTIVSGLARGIDAAAHRGALAAGGRTLAVLGSGLVSLFPPEHAGLADQVATSGAVLSEFPPRMPALAENFPRRNRIVTGLSLGVIVVEAADRSGALISARHAMEQNREVFAVPGRVDSRMSRGCHRLIRDGATLVESVDDVLEQLGPLCQPVRADEQTVVRHPAELQLNEVEQQVLQAIEAEGTAVDTVVQTTNLPVHQVLATISVLEMRRLVVRQSGNLVARR
jgi:DNA processing protein